MIYIIAAVICASIIIYLVAKKNTTPVIDLDHSDTPPERLQELSDEIDLKVYYGIHYPDVELSDVDEALTPAHSDNHLAVSEIQSILKNVDEEYEQSQNVRHSFAVGHGGPTDEDLKPKGPTFSNLLQTLIDESNMTNVEFYKAAWIDRKLFSAIKNNMYYKPKKETVVACCLGLKLSRDKAEKLLESAGYTLSNAIQWDKIVDYCISHEIYDIDQVNELLYARGEKCIGE